jgi:hypothetical protein
MSDKLYARTGERKRINIEEVNKQKQEEKYTNNVITKKYITQSLKYY